MGLFINKNLNLFEGTRPSEETNQVTYRSDSLSELMAEQKRTLETMKNQYKAIEKQVGKQNRIQTDRWTVAKMRIEEVLENQEQQYQFEQEAIASIERLGRKNEELQEILDKKKSLNEELVSQIEILTRSNEQIVERLDKFDMDQEVILTKMDEQLEMQNQFATSLHEQQTVQTEIVDRLENQEGLMDKILRQLDYFRSVLFERTHFISEKIDKSISFMSNRKTEKK